MQRPIVFPYISRKEFNLFINFNEVALIISRYIESHPQTSVILNGRYDFVALGGRGAIMG